MWWIAVALAADPLETSATVHQLPNGLTVVLEEDHRADVVALHLRYRVGSRDEEPGEYGCAHLFEHLMFEGSRNVPGNQFDVLLTDAGGQNNAWTSEDATAYHMTFPAGAADLALFLESDRMGFLLDGVTQINLENQQSVVLQERAEGLTAPHGRDQDTISKLLFPESHPYSHPVIGTVADVEGFNIEAVEGFWREHYRPRNAVLVLVGDFETGAMLDKVTHWFSDVPDPGPAAARAETAPDPGSARDGLIEDSVDGRTLFLLWPIPERSHPDFPALDLLSYILSSGRGSRLDDAVYFGSRIATDDNAYAYGADLDGSFQLYVTTPHTSLKKIDKKVSKVLAQLAKTPPTVAELERARGIFRNEILDDREYPEDRASALADCLVRTGRPDCDKAVWEAYAKVTPEDVSRVIRTYLTAERRGTLSVVPYGDKGFLAGAATVELP